MSPQSVLDTPELLCRIIELANPAVQVAAAQTCREWNKHAIGSIWGKLSSFIPLLELLAPLQHDGTAWEYGSDAVIKFENWERLQFYGQNVRSILHDDGKRFKNDNGNVRSRTYLTLAAVVANRASFLPNLHTLEWTISQASSIPALGVIASPSIKHIKLIIKSDIDSSRVLNTLLGRMGDLITVDICLPFDTTVQTAEESLSRFLREQPKLSNLRLPPFFVSEKIVASLSGMKLRRLEQPDRGNRRSQHNPLGSQLCFDSEAFSTLTSLDCDMDMTKASTVFSASMAPRCLTKLYISTRHLSDVGDLREFLGILVSTNPMIIALSLNLYSFGSATDAKALTFDDVSQMLRFDLNELTITHDLPLLYGLDHIHQMGAAWPKMDYLSLNDEPLVQDATSSPPGLPPEMLTAFTAHFPVLTTLGVYMRIEEGFEEMLLTPKEKFKKLENFRVGTSSIVGADPEEVAAFLASMMPNPKVCIVNTYSSWYPRPLEGVVNNLGWDGVVKAVSACFKAQKRLLRDLKDKEALLEEQRAINASLQEIEISLQTQITALKAEHEACLTQTETTVKQSATTQTPEVPSVESEASTAVKEYQTADVPLRCTIRSEVVSGWPIPDLSPQY